MNYNPELVALNMQDAGPAKKESPPDIKDKKTFKKIIIDEINEGDIVNHLAFGEMKVGKIEIQDKMKVLFSCKFRKNGVEDGDELLLVRDDMDQCFMSNSLEVNIIAKIHNYSLSNQIQTQMPVTSKVSEFINPL